MIHKITKSIINVPIAELHNFCIQYDCNIDIDSQEITIMELHNNIKTE